MALLKPFHLKVAQQILDSYNNSELPFHLFFSQMAQKNKQWGSRDRKIYKKIIYNYFRLGFLTKNKSIESVYENLNLDETQEIKPINYKDIFPDYQLISPKLNHQEWIDGLQHQRPVYLHIVKEKDCEDWFKTHDINFKRTNNNCFQIDADVKCNELIEKGWAWIMDYASQELISQVTINLDESVWDCCSGAGGKSLFLRHKYGNKLNLMCSDLRIHILDNLKQRFLTHQFELPRIELIDLKEKSQFNELFDVIIADVPCSGSGTWGRNPENITKTQLVDFYSDLQKEIVKNALKNLKKGGRFYYMTCSVFRKENEDNALFFESEYQLKAIKNQYFYKNYQESDFLFMAEFLKE